MKIVEINVTVVRDIRDEASDKNKVLSITPTTVDCRTADGKQTIMRPRDAKLATELGRLLRQYNGEK